MKIRIEIHCTLTLQLIFDPDEDYCVIKESVSLILFYYWNGSAKTFLIQIEVLKISFR